jgi:hypothetical protein
MISMKSKQRVSYLFLAGMFGILSLVAAQTPLGPQFQVDPSDTPTPTNVASPAGLVFDAAGTLWMAWENDEPDVLDVFVRSLPRSGTLTPALPMLPIGASAPHLVLAPNGLALFGLTAAIEIQMQRFNAAGVRRGHSVLLQRIQPSGPYHPYGVASLPGGGFFVAWSAGDGPPNIASANVFGRVFDGFGNPLTRPFRIPETFQRVDKNVTGVVADPEGNVFVTWSQPVPGDPLQYAVFARRFSRDGHPLSPEIRVSRQTPAFGGSAAAGPQGSFVLTWLSFDAASKPSVWARRFSARGNPLGPELRVSQQGADILDSAAVAVSRQGDFFIAWTAIGCATCDAEDIHGRLFHADGTAEEEFRVNEETAGSQLKATVAFAPDGRLAVSWTSSPEGEIFDLDARLFSIGAAGPP